MVLELGKLEYTRLEYLLLKKIKNYTVLKSGKLEYYVNFFFWDNQQINIKIKISSFFYVFIYLNRSIVKYIDFNFEIRI